MQSLRLETSVLFRADVMCLWQNLLQGSATHLSSQDSSFTLEFLAFFSPELKSLYSDTMLLWEAVPSGPREVWWHKHVHRCRSIANKILGANVDLSYPDFFHHFGLFLPVHGTVASLHPTCFLRIFFFTRASQCQNFFLSKSIIMHFEGFELRKVFFLIQRYETLMGLRVSTNISYNFLWRY